MNIIREKYAFFNQNREHIPKRLRHLFALGFWGISTEHVASIRENMRFLTTNIHTAKTHAWRLTKQVRFHEVIPALLKHLHLVTERSSIALDFSGFHGVWVLTFALMTGTGRAIPIYIRLLERPVRGISQNLFIIRAIQGFVRATGVRPCLVMDRGFMSADIIEHLIETDHPFILRVKGGKKFKDERENCSFPAKQAPKNDQLVWTYRHLLRLVVSDHPKKKGGDAEPWFLLTNDMEATREEIISWYVHRFEIEEFFKDAKWLMGLERVHIKKMDHLEVLLWFLVLGWWLFFILEQRMKVPTWMPKDALSFPKYLFDLFSYVKQRLFIEAAFGGREAVPI